MAKMTPWVRQYALRASLRAQHVQLSWPLAPDLLEHLNETEQI